MNTEAIDLILEQNPQLRQKRQAFEALKPGTHCWHHSWGLGCIKEYDEVKNRVIIDFERQEGGHSMDPVFCVQKLKFISEDHVLIEARKNSEIIKELAKSNPCELVVKVIKSTGGSNISKLELELMLGHVLSEIFSAQQFSKWWFQTQKAMIKDSRIATPKKRSDGYILREEPIMAEQEVLEEFYLTRRPLEKISLAKKLYQLAGSIDDIKNDLPNVLDDLTTAIKNAKQLTQAERLQGCWIRNDLARYLQEAVDELQPTSGSIIMEAQNLSELAESLPHTSFGRFLDLITRTYPSPAEWQHICIQLLKNSTGKLTSEVINFLLERDCETLLSDTFSKWLQEQSMKSPVILWIIKQRNMQRYQNLIKPLICPRMLSAIFQAIDWDALNVSQGRKIQLVEAVNNDKEIISDLLADSDLELARDLARNLLLNQGFDTLKKRSIMARFIRLFPELQKLAETKNSAQKEERLLVSQESLDAARREYEDIVSEKIPANKAAIVAARELGDLKENSEYKMARQDQDVLLARKAQIEKDLMAAQVIKFEEAPTDIVGIGSVVIVEDNKGKRQSFTIAGAWDGDPKKNILSYKSPFAEKLLGKKVGDTMDLNLASSTQQFTIVSIERWDRK